jgi:GTPase Era involved in 16S rRNA processing
MFCVSLNFQVTDTPGLFDGGGDEDEKNKELLKSIILSLPGPHVFLLVFNGKGRFAENEMEVLNRLKQYFHEEGMERFIIIVFTNTVKSKLKDVMNDSSRQVHE